jgi:hypothetical protein
MVIRHLHLQVHSSTVMTMTDKDKCSQRADDWEAEQAKEKKKMSWEERVQFIRRATARQQVSAERNSAQEFASIEICNICIICICIWMHYSMAVCTCVNTACYVLCGSKCMEKASK